MKLRPLTLLPPPCQTLLPLFPVSVSVESGGGGAGGTLQPTPVCTEMVAPVALSFMPVDQRPLGLARAQAAWFGNGRVPLLPLALPSTLAQLCPRSPGLVTCDCPPGEPCGCLCSSCSLYPYGYHLHACSGCPGSRCEGQSLGFPVLSHPSSPHLPPCSQGHPAPVALPDQRGSAGGKSTHSSPQCSPRVAPPLLSGGPDSSGRSRLG